MDLKSPCKLSLIFLLVAAPATMALAQPVDCPLCSFSGFSVGLGLGATTLMTNTNSNITLTSDHPIILTPIPPIISLVNVPTSGNEVSNNASSKTFRYGGMGALYVGYGNVFDNHTYLGAELGYNLFGATHTNMHDNATNNTDYTHSDGDAESFGEAFLNTSLDAHTTVSRNAFEPFLDLKAGFLITPTVLTYIKGGINYNTIKVKSDAAYQATGIASGFPNSTFPLTATTSSLFETNRQKNAIGYRAGIGMEVMVTPQIGVGADYVYTFYQNVRGNRNSSGTDVACDSAEGCITVPASVTSSNKTAATDQQVMAQLIYHLGQW